MPRAKSTAPAYQFHVSGQAVVNLDRQRFYLGKHGKHGTPESYARNHSLLAECNANGMKAPQKGSESDPSSERLAETSILVKHVTADYRNGELPKCKHNVGDHGWRSNLLDLIDKSLAKPIDRDGHTVTHQSTSIET